MNNIIDFLAIILFIFSCRPLSDESKIMLPLLDSADITEVYKNPYYERFGFKSEYNQGVFYVLVESLGDFYAVNRNGDILWNISLNEQLRGPNGPSVLFTSTEDFIFVNSSLYFLQNNNLIVQYDLDGNEKMSYSIDFDIPGTAIAIRHFSGERFILLWHESFKPDYTSEYTIFEIDLSQSYSARIFNRKISYPRSRIAFDVSGDEIYVFEDIQKNATLIQKADHSYVEIPLPQSEWRDYAIRKVYKGDVASYSNLNVFERRAFSNDYYRQARIVEDHFFLHHYVYQRSETPNPFKDLVTVQFPNGNNEDILLQDQVLNLDDHGNYFSIRTIEGKIYLKISPILSISDD